MTNVYRETYYLKRKEIEKGKAGVYYSLEKFF